jgi:anti-sigma B factor antagonist
MALPPSTSRSEVSHAGQIVDLPQEVAMNLTLNMRQEGDVIIFGLTGRIVLGEESAAFRERVCDLLAEEHRKTLLNLADVDYIDSTGLAHLVGALVSVRKLNGEIKLLDLSNRIRDLLQITKLHTVLESFDSEATAVESFVHSVAASG